MAAPCEPPSAVYGVAPSDLVAAIDSRNIAHAEEARSLTREGLGAIREPILFNTLWDYYMRTNSINAAKLLTGVAEHQSGRLFDKLNEAFLNVKTRLLSLCLIGYLIRREPPPSWLHKIVETPLFINILRCLKSEYNVSILMGALLAVTALLPSIPVAVGPYLRELCDIFMRLLAWLCSTYLGDVSEVLVLHLRVGVYAYFHRLYAMYPNHFIQYLQTQCNVENESATDFRETIRPYLESVRLHPFLVLGNKQAETHVYRWRKYDSPAILEECSKLCLDPSLTCTAANIFQDPTESKSQEESKSSEQTSLHLTRNLYWRRSDSSRPPTSLSETDSALILTSSLRTIASASSISLSSSENQAKSKIHDESQETLFNSSYESSGSTSSHWYKELESGGKTSGNFSSSFPNNRRSLGGGDSRRRRHTVNAVAHQRSVSLDASERYDDFSSVARPAFMWQSDTDLPTTKSDDETANCTMRTSIVVAPIEQVSELTTNVEGGDDDSTQSSSFVSLHVSTPRRVIRTFSHLLPSALPIPAEVEETQTKFSSESEKETRATRVPAHQGLSPVHLLDRHLELGRVLHAKESSSIPMTYLEGTDWSHFGESPQADEVAILKSQVLLLHTQLMYERHLREQHDQRNRSLLRRSHQASKAEEELWALRNQLEVQSKEYEKLQIQIKVENERERAKLDMGRKMEDVLREQLRISADENQIMKESQAAAVMEAKRLRRDVQELKKEIDATNEEKLRWRREVDDMRPKVRAAEQLQAQLDALSQDFLYIADLFDDHLHIEGSHSRQEMKLARLESELAALHAERKGAEELSRQRAAQLLKHKAKAEELEIQLKDKAMAFEQQQQVIDDIKSRNEAQLKAVEEKCAGLKVANQYLETHIMELYGRLDSSSSRGGHRIPVVVGSESSTSLASTPGMSSCVFSRSPDDQHETSGAVFPS